jgi:hypothetical protein
MTRARQILITILAILCGAALVAAGVLFVAVLAKPAPPSFKYVWSREGYVLLDRSWSMTYKHSDRLFRESKERIKRSVLPALGAGDRVSCYGVSTDFVEAENRIFDSSEMPPIPDSLLDPERAALVPRSLVDALSSRVRTVVDDPVKGFAAKLDAVVQERKGWSNYLPALEYIGERVTGSADSDVRERFIIVVGDLEQDPKPLPGGVPVRPGDRALFAGVNVVLVDPYRFVQGGDPAARYVLRDFWTKYFTDRGATSLVIKALDDSDGLLPPSLVTASSHLEARAGRRPCAKEETCHEF